MAMFRKMKVFIGCASESRATGDWIAAIVADCGHKPLPWYDVKAFLAGKTILPRLIELSREVDAAILVFSAIDKVRSRGTRASQPRDNVLLEFGLFVAALGQERSIVCAVGKPKIPVDLSGIAYVDATNQYDAKRRLEEWIKSVENGPVDPDVVRIGHFKSADHGRFTERVQNRLADASNIVMMGSGVAILGKPAVAEDLMRRASKRKGGKVELFLANPLSPAVEMRLIEEEQGSIPPPDGKRGLLGRLEMLLSCWKRFGRPKNVKINLCSHYPTFALLIIDDDYFVYPYSYRLLGNLSPVLVFSRKDVTHKDIVQFLDNHYARVKADSVDAEKILKPSAISRKELCTFAVFFVPRADSELYTFGTEVIGYDVRARGQVQSQWKRFVGKAGEFGFHLTVCDALYFGNAAEVRSAAAEVKYLAKEFRPFKLRVLKLKHDYPRRNQVALVVADPSDELQCIHQELVHRIYGRAIASDYTLDQVSHNGYTRTASVHMLSRYGAPYILSKFQPHFTLLSNCQPESWDLSGNDLNKSFATMVSKHDVTVDRLAIMRKSIQNGRWVIDAEFDLGMSGETRD